MLHESHSHPAKAQESQRPVSSFDEAELMARCLGNLKLIQRVLTAFSETFCQDCILLRQRLDEQDFESVQKLAHRMRGASGNVAARRLHSLCTELEETAPLGNLSQIASQLDTLLDEWQNFQQFTQPIMKAQ